MDVAHFELIFKPQSPAAPTGTAAVARVIQGFFLEITNLEPVEYQYQLEFVAPPPAPGVANAAFRSLAGNALIFVDTPAADNQQGVLTGAPGATVFRPSTGFVRIPPLATALVAVLPSAFGPVPGDPTPIPNPVFEVRGFVRLKLPALFQPGHPCKLVRKAQSADPVKVLLTAQNRATYLDASGAITDQTQASLPLCAGAACVHLEPEPCGPIVLVPHEAPADPHAIVCELFQNGEFDDPVALAGILAATLSAIDPEASDLTGFNRALREAGTPFAVERRKP